LHARDLGVTIDSRLTMADQVAVITRSLSTDAAKAAVQAFIICRLEYRNSDDLLQRLQSMQYVAASLPCDGNSSPRSHHAGPAAAALAACHAACRVQADTVGVQGVPR